jgi:hypothetical protein
MASVQKMRAILSHTIRSLPLSVSVGEPASCDAGITVHTEIPT